MDEAVTQVNVSMPRAIDKHTLCSCLKAGEVPDAWSAHLRVFVEEVPPETLHLGVLDGAYSFADIHRMKTALRSDGGKNGPWIDEMARLELARDAEGRAAGSPGVA